MTVTDVQPFELTADQVASFAADGFVIIDRLISPDLARAALDRYEAVTSQAVENLRAAGNGSVISFRRELRAAHAS